MANPEHLRILNRGVLGWNNWRESERGKTIIPDLRNADLKGIDLTKANLRGVNLKKALLDDAKFIKADLTEANLRESSLQYADFSYAKLIKTDFYRANIYKASFANVHFDEANFAKATGIETVGLDLTVSDGYTLETINTRTEGSYFVSTKDGRNQANIIFKDGIDWLAFITVYGEINKEIAGKTEEGNKLEIIEIKKYNNSLNVKVKLPPYIDRKKVENAFKIKYEIRERELHNYYKNKLNIKDTRIEDFKDRCTSLEELLKYAVTNKSINNSINIGDVGGDVSGLGAGMDITGIAGRDIRNQDDFRGLLISILAILALFLFLSR